MKLSRVPRKSRVILNAALGAFFLAGVLTASAQQPATFASIPAAFAAWQAADDAAGHAAARGWIEARVRTSASQSELRDAIQYLGRIAAADESGKAFLALCAARARDVEPALRPTIVLQVSDWHTAAGNPEAALAALTDFLATGPAPADHSITARKAAGLLTDQLSRPADAAKLLAEAMATVTTNVPASFADLGMARAILLSETLGDSAGAEADLRRILALGAACPQMQLLSAGDRLAAILAATGRADDIPEILMSVWRYATAPPTGFARKLTESGASARLLEEALVLLRRSIATASPVELQRRIENNQPESLELLLALGRSGEAVGECRAYTLSATDGSYSKAIELAARCLKQHDGNLGKANALLDLHAAGRTMAGTADNPLFSTPQLADPVRVEALAAPLPAPADWNGWLNRSLLLCWLDRPAESLAAARMAFTACPVVSNTLQTCANAVARPVLAVTRDAALAQRLVDYLVLGPDGPDALPGTADDIEEPFSEAERRLAFPALAARATEPPKAKIPSETAAPAANP